ncbi:hypothetical protein D3C75_1075810 [compost metagenome]
MVRHIQIVLGMVRLLRLLLGAQQSLTETQGIRFQAEEHSTLQVTAVTPAGWINLSLL